MSNSTTKFAACTHALGILEIVRLIIEEHCALWNSRDLYKLFLVCKRFNEIAVHLLWRKFNDDVGWESVQPGSRRQTPAVHYQPSITNYYSPPRLEDLDIFIENPGDSGDANPKCALTRDWKRILLYTSCVKSLTICSPQYDDCSNSVKSAPSPMILFPAAQELHLRFYTDAPDCLRILEHCLPQTIQTLTITIKKPRWHPGEEVSETSISALYSFIFACPTALTSFDIFFNDTYGRESDLAFFKNLAAKLDEFRNLRHLGITLDFPVLSRLRALHFLQSIEIDLTEYPAALEAGLVIDLFPLETIHVDSLILTINFNPMARYGMVCWRTLCPLINVVPARSLGIKMCDSLIDSTDISPLLRKVLKEGCANSLTHFDMGGSASDLLIDGIPAVRCHFDQIPPEFVDFAPLLQLHRLQTVRICTELPMRLDDSDPQKIVDAWPSIKCLRFLSGFPVDFSGDPAQAVSLAALTPFARCRHLRELEVLVHARSTDSVYVSGPGLTEGSPSPSPLEVLNLSYSTLSNKNIVPTAQNLMRYFPRLKTLVHRYGSQDEDALRRLNQSLNTPTFNPGGASLETFLERRGWKLWEQVNYHLFGSV